jgi:dTDP-glucose 4,6-dehydratase
MRVLITGGCGFIGHHLVNHLLINTDWDIVVWDKLTYAANGFDRLRDINVFDNKRVHIFTVDISEPFSDGVVKETGNINYIVHMAAETHVDKSISTPIQAVKSNVLGTAHMLEYARTLSALKKFLYFGTDEVFGPAPIGVSYKEWDRYNSTNPYSSSKAGGEELVLAWANTYKLPVIIIHSMNAFGERQHPEKFFPLIIRSVIEGKKVYIHADKECKTPGSRFYLHCRNIADAILFLLNKDVELRDKFNVVGMREVDNLELAQYIAQIIGKKLHYKLVDFHSSRPGHDLRYALDGTKMKELGWEPPVGFTESLARTVGWYFKNNNKRWLYF